MDDTLFYSFFLVAAIIIITLVLSRILVRRRVTKMMMDKSDHQDLEQPPVLSPSQEVPAISQPVIIRVDYDSDLPEAIVERNKMIAQAQEIFKRARNVNLIAALGYLIIPSLVSILIIWAFEEKKLPGGEASIVASWFAVVPLGYISYFRYMAFKNQFKAYHKGLGGIYQKFKRALFTFANPKWSGYITILVISISIIVGIWSLFFYSFSDSLGYFSAAAFHLWLVLRLRKSLARTSNLKLLILRVFGINETATFTFEGLLNYWQYFGSFFTIVDSSFLRSSVRQRNQIIPMIVISFFLLTVLVGKFEESGIDPTLLPKIIIPSVVLAGYFYIRYSLKMVDRSFIKSKEDLDSRLEKLEKSPRKLDHTFKSLPTMCFDNTWKIAVSEYVHHSDLILMDLRGFSEERKGCEYEVDFLFDQVSVSKVVFLVNSDGFELTEKLINERWAMQHPDSPNLSISKPEVQVYVSSKENKKDIQGIMDVLMNTVAKQVEVVPSKMN